MNKFDPRYFRQADEAGGSPAPAEEPKGRQPEESQPDYNHYVKRGQGTQPRRKNRPIVPVLIAVLITFVLTAGLFYTLYSQGILEPLFASEEGDLETSAGFTIEVTDADAATRQQAEKLASLLELVSDNYYQEIDDEDLIAAMSAGFPSALGSPYTYYMTPEEVTAMEEQMTGEYSGIGATVAWNISGYNEIIEVVPDGPADRAGVQAGDIPVRVDGQNVADFSSTAELANLVKGEEGTTVTIAFYRPSLGREIEFSIVRADIVTEAVSYRMINDTVGYLEISSFQNQLQEEFIPAIDALVADGAENIIFDLRNNPGGSANSVIACLDYLLPEGEIARTEGRSDGETYVNTWTSDEEIGVPDTMRYAILVNNNSASASELFSGCLRDYGKAVLIGEQTYGKGSGTRTYTLDDGSAVTITVFEYILPRGQRLENVGLVPHILVSLPVELRTEAISRLDPDEDNQLQTAVDWLADLKNGEVEIQDPSAYDADKDGLLPTPPPQPTETTTADSGTTEP